MVRQKRRHRCALDFAEPAGCRTRNFVAPTIRRLAEATAGARLDAVLVDEVSRTPTRCRRELVELIAGRPGSNGGAAFSWSADRKAIDIYEFPRRGTWACSPAAAAAELVVRGGGEELPWREVAGARLPAPLFAFR